MRHAPVALLTLAALAGCSPGGSTASAPPSASGAATAPVETVNFAFSPARITGRPGGRLTLVLHNGTTTQHNFTLADQHVNTDLAARSTTRVTVTVPVSGQLVFTCEYHAGRGMKGVLTPGPDGGAPVTTQATPGGGGGTGY